MDRELAWFGMAATVVAAAGATPEQVATAYGLGLATDTEEVSFDDEAHDRVSIFVAGGGTFAVEPNGFTAGLPGVVEALSVSTHAPVACAFWHVSMILTFACADHGSLVFRGELDEPDHDGLPSALAELLTDVDDLAEAAPGSWPLRCAAMGMLEAWTGMLLTAQMVLAAADRPALVLGRRPPLLVRGYDANTQRLRHRERDGSTRSGEDRGAGGAPDARAWKPPAHGQTRWPPGI